MIKKIISVLNEKNILITNTNTINEKIEYHKNLNKKEDYIKDINISIENDKYSYTLTVSHKGNCLFNMHQSHNPYMQGWNYFFTEEEALDCANRQADDFINASIEGAVFESVVEDFIIEDNKKREDQANKLSILEAENKELREELSATQDAVNEMLFMMLNMEVK